MKKIKLLKSAKNNKSSLKDLIEQIDWLMIEPGRGSTRLPADCLSVAFCQSKKNINKIDEVRIRFGSSVLEKIEWSPGDKITVYHHPDDLMSFLLVKSDSGVGYTLAQESGSPSSRLHFKWNRPLILHKMSPKSVPYEIYKKYISFRASDSENLEE